MKLSRKDLLETLLFDSENIVTVYSFSRKADIAIDEANRLLKDFYESNKSMSKLDAVYVISGKMQNLNEEGNKCISRTQLVREKNLDQIRKLYESIDTCELYCLHTKTIKSLYILYSIDRLDDEQYSKTDHERSWISCPAARMRQIEMLEQHHTVSNSNQQNVKPYVHLVKTESNKFKKGTIDAQFAKAAEKPKIKKDEDDAMNIEQNEHSKQTAENDANINKKSRGQPILIDNEEDSDFVENAFLKSTTSIKIQKSICGQKEKRKMKQRNEAYQVCDEMAQNVEVNVSKGIEESTDSLAKKARIFDDSWKLRNDLFSDGLSSPEPMEMDTESIFSSEPQADESQNSPSRIASSKSELTEDDNCVPKKLTKRELGTETFIDSDGFLVTKQVLKEVDIDKDVIEKPHVPSTKPAVIVPQNIPRKQSKINAFFKKK